MDSRRSELIQTLRAEALALFQANQAGRLAAERATQLLLTITGVAVAAAINSGRAEVLMALPPLVLLLLSYMLQQYVDVSVLGKARHAIEHRLHDELGGHALIYETIVAEIKQQRPLVWSVRVFQTLIGFVALGVVIVGSWIAIGQPAGVLVGYVVLTLATSVSALMSFRDMHRSEDIAAPILNAALAIDRTNAGHGEPLADAPGAALDS